jgi:cell division protein YceG involved in septum cleavage
MEIKRCARCGGFFETINEVCNCCMAKDNKDLGKLKNYLSYGFIAGSVTREEVSANTGITMKNLNRFLAGDEFEGVFIPETLATNNNIDDKKIIAKV